MIQTTVQMGLLSASSQARSQPQAACVLPAAIAASRYGMTGAIVGGVIGLAIEHTLSD